MSDLQTRLRKEFEYFLKRLPEIVQTNPELVARMLDNESSSDLPGRFCEEMPFYTKAEVWTSLAVLISFVVMVDQGKVRPGKAWVV